MNLLPTPIVCTIQNIPGLAISAVDMLLEQLSDPASPGDLSAALPATIVRNPAFEKLID